AAVVLGLAVELEAPIRSKADGNALVAIPLLPQSGKVILHRVDFPQLHSASSMSSASNSVTCLRHPSSVKSDGKSIRPDLGATSVTQSQKRSIFFRLRVFLWPCVSASMSANREGTRIALRPK